jgi:hypothetical protein
MHACDGAADRKPDPGAADRGTVPCARLRQAHPLERLEDPRAPCNRGSRSAVAHGQHHPVAGAPRDDFHRRLRTAVLERVVHEVVEQLDHQHGVASDQGQTRIQLRCHAVRRVSLPDPPEHRPDDLLDRFPVAAQDQTRRIETGKLQRVVGESGKLCGLVDDRLGQPPPLLRRKPLPLVLQRRRSAEDRGERCTVIVSDRGQQRVAQRLQLRSLASRSSSLVGRCAFQGRPHLVAERLRMREHRGDAAFGARRNRQKCSTEAGTASTHRQVERRLFLVSRRARPHGLAAGQADPQPGPLVVRGGAEQHAAGGVRSLRRPGREHEQGRPRTGQAGKGFLQNRPAAGGIVGIAQGFAEASQLVGASRVHALVHGKLTLPRHQQRDDPAHPQHRHEQQHVLVQIDGERAPGWHEHEVEHQHHHRAGGHRDGRPAPQGSHGGHQHEDQCLIGEVYPAVEDEYRHPAGQPDEPGQPSPGPDWGN